MSEKTFKSELLVKRESFGYRIMDDVGRVAWVQGTSPRSKLVADSIVAAVNQHEKLLATLRSSRMMLALVPELLPLKFTEPIAAQIKKCDEVLGDL
jgi:hypothetical protein